MPPSDYDVMESESSCLNPIRMQVTQSSVSTVRVASHVLHAHFLQFAVKATYCIVRKAQPWLMSHSGMLMLGRVQRFDLKMKKNLILNWHQVLQEEKTEQNMGEY